MEKLVLYYEKMTLTWKGNKKQIQLHLDEAMQDDRVLKITKQKYPLKNNEIQVLKESKL